jgi:uncharacterized protein
MTPTETLGIPQLDRILGPIPLRSSIVLANDPGVEAEPFLYQAAHQHLADGRSVIYAVFSRPPSSVKRGMQEFGFDTAESKKLVFLDAYSPLMASTEAAAYELAAPSDPQRLIQLLEKAIHEIPDAILILDGLTTLIDQVGPEKFVPVLPALRQTIARFRAGLTLLTRWPYDNFAAFLEPFDAIVTLRGVEERVMLNQYFLVERARWRTDLQSKPVLYRTIRPGGVYVYIPKIVVTGPYHAGKSTFVQTLSDTAVSVNRLGTTVALDHGHVTIDGLTADIFGTPGQERFDPLLKTIAGQALGVIVVVDSSRPDSFPRAREMMELTGKQGLPMIVAANKQDTPGALKPEDVAQRLGAPAHVRVMGCTGQDRESSRHVLRELIDHIMTKVTT